eukprot:6174947-Pleurochrysis_carterae.AAC.1
MEGNHTHTKEGEHVSIKGRAELCIVAVATHGNHAWLACSAARSESEVCIDVAASAACANNNDNDNNNKTSRYRQSQRDLQNLANVSTTTGTLLTKFQVFCNDGLVCYASCHVVLKNCHLLICLCESFAISCMHERVYERERRE